MEPLTEKKTERERADEMLVDALKATTKIAEELAKRSDDLYDRSTELEDVIRAMEKQLADSMARAKYFRNLHEQAQEDLVRLDGKLSGAELLVITLRNELRSVILDGLSLRSIQGTYASRIRRLEERLGPEPEIVEEVVDFNDVVSSQENQIRD